MKILLFISCLLVSLTHGMQTSKESSDTVEHHPRYTICFLHHYAHATFTDPYLYKTNIDDEGVSYGGISNDDRNATYALPWFKVKTILNKAYEDIARVDVTKENVGFTEEYRQVLWYVCNYDAQDCKDGHFAYVYENRKKYKDAFISANVPALKEALQSDLFLPHID